MKKYFLVLTMLLSGQLMFAQSGGPTDGQLTVEVINDVRLSEQIRSMFNSLQSTRSEIIAGTQISSFSESDFDFINIYKSQKSGEREVGYSVKYINPPAGFEYSFSLVSNSGVLSYPMVVKVKSDRSRIVYNSLLEGTSLDVINDAGQFSYTIRNVDFGRGTGSGGTDCGQCVANCISDAYSNHGWASVWAVVQSIFIPATGVGIALGCTARCCVH